MKTLCEINDIITRDGFGKELLPIPSGTEVKLLEAGAYSGAIGTAGSPDTTKEFIYQVYKSGTDTFIKAFDKITGEGYMLTASNGVWAAGWSGLNTSPGSGNVIPGVFPDPVFPQDENRALVARATGFVYLPFGGGGGGSVNISSSFNIENTYQTKAELLTANPTPKDSEAHLVLETRSVWIYSDKDHAWHEIRNVQGPRGQHGVQGIRGTEGTQGRQGLKGDRGARGDQGPTGPEGQEGHRGIIGPKGIQGRDGKDGLGVQVKGFDTIRNIEDKTGIAGDVWIATDVGDKQGHGYLSDGLGVGPTHWQDIGKLEGPAGINGTNGAEGPPGIQGQTGPMGPLGDQGPKGDQGETGPDGPEGIQGNQGIPGVDGNDGLEGSQGLQGSRGQTGDDGQRGIKGDRGDVGPGIHFKAAYANYQTMVAAGNAHPPTLGDTNLVVDTGHLWIYYNPHPPFGTTGADWHDVGHVQGPKGEKGDTGPVGHTGANGIQGIHGVHGPEGHQGVQGLKGDIGPMGSTGLTGLTGKGGAVGPQGERGDGINFGRAYIDFAALHAHNPNPALGDAHLTKDDGNIWVFDNPNPPHDIANASWHNIGHMRGPEGVMGPAGDVGHQGMQGQQGPQGHYGHTGAEGAAGPRGHDGTPGIEGVKGDRGHPGASLNFEHAYATKAAMVAAELTPEIGDTHLVLDGGDLWVYDNPHPPHDPKYADWHDVGHVKGPKGEEGPAGPPGPLGHPGPAGHNGLPGAKGQHGIQGLQGSQGKDGPRGSTGPQGTRGASGQSANMGNYYTKHEINYTPMSSSKVFGGLKTRLSGTTLYMRSNTSNA